MKNKRGRPLTGESTPLRLRRLKLGVTQQQLADMISTKDRIVRQESIGRFERGEMTPDLLTGLRLGEVLRIPCSRLGSYFLPAKKPS
jgi:transcriptional regulator with XRE-family HTH domain